MKWGMQNRAFNDFLIFDQESNSRGIFELA